MDLRPDIREQSYLVAGERSASKWEGVHMRTLTDRRSILTEMSLSRRPSAAKLTT